MPSTAKGQTLFDLSGGHPALDLVNSLDNRFRHDGPNEILVGYGELLRFLGESALLDTRQIRLLGKGASGEAAEQTLRSVRASCSIPGKSGFSAKARVARPRSRRCAQ